MTSNKLTKAIEEVNKYLTAHVNHISAAQRKVFRRRKAKLKKQLRTYEQKTKAAFQTTHQLTINI